MKQTSQSGVTALQVIIALTLVAVAFGLISTLMGSSDEQEVAGTNSPEVQQNTPIETFAQNKAADITAPVTDAVEEKNEEMDISTAPEADTTATLPVDAVTPEPVNVSAAGTFETYSEEKLALAADGNVVLFFHANWCPSCRGLENNLNANLDNIPANTHILKLDYDTETELKKKYKVIRQHTLVVVDANGNEIKKLTGLTNTLDQVVGQL